jgi:hypothetical protein
MEAWKISFGCDLFDTVNCTLTVGTFYILEAGWDIWFGLVIKILCLVDRLMNLIRTISAPAGRPSSLWTSGQPPT